LQCVAVCCSVSAASCLLFCVRMIVYECCCVVLQCAAVRCSVLPCVAVCCSMLQCVAVCCSVLLSVAACPNVRAAGRLLLCVCMTVKDWYCAVLRCVAVCCSVLQCVAVCCSVLQCVAVCCSIRTVNCMPMRVCMMIYEFLQTCTTVSTYFRHLHTLCIVSAGCQRIVRSPNRYVSFAKKPFKNRAVFQKTMSNLQTTHRMCGVSTTCRLPKLPHIFCQRALQKQGYFPKDNE